MNPTEKHFVALAIFIVIICVLTGIGCAGAGTSDDPTDPMEAPVVFPMHPPAAPPPPPPKYVTYKLKSDVARPDGLLAFTVDYSADVFPDCINVRVDLTVYDDFGKVNFYESKTRLYTKPELLFDAAPVDFDAGWSEWQVFMDRPAKTLHVTRIVHVGNVFSEWSLH